MRKSAVSKKSKSKGKEVKRENSLTSKKSKQTVQDQSVVNMDQSVNDDPADAALLAKKPSQEEQEENAIVAPQRSELSNNQPDGAEGIEMQSLEGSIQNEDGALQNDLERAGTEKDHPQGENELEMELENADQFTNFERADNQLIDGSAKQSDQSNPNPFDDDEADKDMGDKNELDDVFDVNQIEDFGLDQSIHPLTLKGGEEQNIYPDGFDDDDLNQNNIAKMEQQIKVNEMRNEIHDDDGLDDKIRDEYMVKFRKEVDFHHKVAYRFEKAYRLGKKHPAKKHQLNQEIIDIITEHSDYIDQDKMALFYCLYFCVYYNNPDLVEFLRTLVQKMPNRPDKIDKLLEHIDVNGIDRLRTIGEQINTFVYHMVFYQAVDDELRVVYAQILRQLRVIQLRDTDAEYLLMQRDYDLINITFTKTTTKLATDQFFKEKLKSIKSQTYRQYNQAYYEEILIDYSTEARVAQNYRERFLVSAEDVLLVLKMYAKNDYNAYFLHANLDDITHKQFIELFEISLLNDAMKCAMQIYLRYLTAFDISFRIMDILINSLKDSTRYHELKLFYIHQHFDILTISQMNNLVDIYMEILNRPNYKYNPMLSQFNTIKYSLLIYRISWKIAEKKIYSLITKCSLMNNYIYKSLEAYLERQHHISQLYNFMREPILHMTERKDSLDFMLEMNMESLLNNPVIVEVLNLVNEGKYSVDSSAASLSQTFQCFFLMDTADLKSINDRLIQNIQSLGEAGGGKQSSLQFHIWKQCIEQREQDEMMFTVLISLFFISLTFFIDVNLSKVIALMEDEFGQNFIGQIHVFINAKPEIIESYCTGSVDGFRGMYSAISLLNILVIISCIGYLTAVIQKITVVRLKDNVQLSIGHIMLEFSIVCVSAVFIFMNAQDPTNKLITDTCAKYVTLGGDEIKEIDYVTAIIFQSNSLSFQLIVSALVILQAMIMIVMLQRTDTLGDLIMMVNQMINELQKFIITFGMLIGGFIIVGRQLNEELKVKESSFFQIILDIFDGFNGKQNFDHYKYPQGKLFITIFVYIFNILLLSFLVAMFINRYKFVYKNLAALRRMNIIKLKNSSSFDNISGGVTITFFPISILVLPFIIPVVMFKSERLNDFILKIQYAFMIILYCGIAVSISIPIIPTLYMKCVFNAVFILLNNKRQDYRGQNVVMFLVTVIFNPIIMFVSLIVDLLSLPNLLLRDERNFEYKYQQSLEILSKAQVDVIITTFAKIFYVNFEQDYAGKGMTLIELMVMHRKIFSIIDNLHDLCCKGTKDYRQALANVQDYNMTKILTRKCSVPDKNGDIKESSCDFSVLYSIQMDIELYSYLEMLFRDYRSGKISAELASAKEKKNKNNSKTEELTTYVGTIRIHASRVFLVMGMAPQGLTFKRDNADVMNNFFVNIVTRSYTNIEEYLQARQDNIEMQKQKETLKELENIKKTWTTGIQGEVVEQMNKFDKSILSFNKSVTDQKMEDNTIITQKSKGNINSVRNGEDLDDLHDL